MERDNQQPSVTNGLKVVTKVQRLDTETAYVDNVSTKTQPLMLFKCSVCKCFKESSKYSKSTKYPRGYDYRCKSCNGARNKIRWAKISDKEKVRRQAIMDSLTEEELLELKETKSLKHKEWCTKNMKQLMLNRARERSREGNYPCTITIDDLIFPDICPLLLVPFNRGGRGNRWYTHSLDKIDPSKGYIPGNIMIISYLANTMKNTATPKELVTFAKNILKMFDDVEDIV